LAGWEFPIQRQKCCSVLPSHCLGLSPALFLRPRCHRLSAKSQTCQVCNTDLAGLMRTSAAQVLLQHGIQGTMYNPIYIKLAQAYMHSRGCKVCAYAAGTLCPGTIANQVKQELHTVTASLSQPPVPEFPSICTFTGTGGVHSTLRYWMSILPLSIGAICSLANPCSLCTRLNAWQ